jgi:hypothetical protein
MLSADAPQPHTSAVLDAVFVQCELPVAVYLLEHAVRLQKQLYPIDAYKLVDFTQVVLEPGTPFPYLLYALVVWMEVLPAFKMFVRDSYRASVYTLNRFENFMCWVDVELENQILGRQPSGEKFPDVSFTDPAGRQYMYCNSIGYVVDRLRRHYIEQDMPV